MVGPGGDRPYNHAADVEEETELASCYKPSIIMVHHGNFRHFRGGSLGSKHGCMVATGRADLRHSERQLVLHAMKFITCGTNKSYLILSYHIDCQIN